MVGAHDGLPVLKPIPRRPFSLKRLVGADSVSYEASPVHEPSEQAPDLLNLDVLNRRLLDVHGPRNVSGATHSSTSMSRAQSTLNLMGSTLHGIFTPTAGERDCSLDHDVDDSPDATQRRRRSLTVPRKRSLPQQAHHIRSLSSLGPRALLLFGLGLLYGALVAKFQHGQNFHSTSLPIHGVVKPLALDWTYMAFWGLFAVVLGGLLPWLDGVWEPPSEWEWAKEHANASWTGDAGELSKPATDWALVVRGIGAFVGIVFAIRKVPWTSTLQVSMCLALVNPVLWYLIDRSRAGFLLSVAVGLTGSTVLLGLKPDMVPTPASRPSFAAYHGVNSSSSHPDWPGKPPLLRGLADHRTLETGIWMLSVLFCCCVFFGNIGRRLALNPSGAVRGRWA